jgi:hypothetical protein
MPWVTDGESVSAPVGKEIIVPVQVAVVHLCALAIVPPAEELMHVAPGEPLNTAKGRPSGPIEIDVAEPALLALPTLFDKMRRIGTVQFKSLQIAMRPLVPPVAVRRA